MRIASRPLGSFRGRAAFPPVIAFLVGCTGAIGGAGESTPGSNPPAGSELAGGALPIRGLTPFELQNTVNDLLGDPATELGSLQPAALKTGVETSGDSELAWTGGRADLLEQVLFSVSTRITGPGGKLGPCAAASGDMACFRAALSDVLPSLYRRPLRSEDVDALVSLAESNVAKLGRQEAMARALELALMSADSLYLTSLGPEGQATGELSPLELAGRMAYLVWASAPDKALIDAAAKGELATPEGLEAQARRLIADPRSERGMARFLLAWSGILNLRGRTKGSSSWSAELASDSVGESTRYLAAWWTSPTPTFSSLLNSNTGFVTQRLADFYGVPFPGGQGFQPVTFPPSSRRRGLLSQASFLTASTAGDASSPTLRGRWVLERALCMPQNLPAANTVSSAPAHTDGEQTRDYHEKLAAAPGCKGCHVNMEATGVPFELFDGTGKLRLQEAGKDVRVNTQLSTGKDVDGTYADEGAFFAALGRSATVRACVASSLARHALGRPAADVDAATVQLVADKLGTNAREAMVALLTSRSFRLVSSK